MPTNAVAMNPKIPASSATSVSPSGNGNVSFQDPLRGKGTVTSGHGWRNHPIRGGRRMHEGTDIAAPEGTPVYSAAPGKVINKAFDKSGYGHYIDVNHGPKMSRYAHLKEASSLSVGDNVTTNTVVGLLGSTGGSTGPHLHFEIRNNSQKDDKGRPKSEDPMQYIADARKASSKKA
jgi:murein DD-endopeptidase MepM/ murein hydrolase activator NlpD